MTKRKREMDIELHAVVDRLEDEEQAVLLVGDDSTSIDFPVSLLPKGTAAGDHLTLHISCDDAARDAAAEKTNELLKALESRTTPPGKKDFKL